MGDETGSTTGGSALVRVILVSVAAALLGLYRVADSEIGVAGEAFSLVLVYMSTGAVFGYFLVRRNCLRRILRTQHEPKREFEPLSSAEDQEDSRKSRFSLHERTPRA